MQHFTPVSAFFGELLIGLDTVVLMLFPSRIAGIAVIVGGLLGFDCREIVWRGGIRPWFDRGPAIGRLGAGRASGSHGRRPAAGGGRFGGLLVDFGTRLGSGCTSGWRLRARAAVGPLARHEARVVLPYAERGTALPVLVSLHRARD